MQRPNISADNLSSPRVSVPPIRRLKHVLLILTDLKLVRQVPKPDQRQDLFPKEQLQALKVMIPRSSTVVYYKYAGQQGNQLYRS